MFAGQQGALGGAAGGVVGGVAGGGMAAGNSYGVVGGGGGAMGGGAVAHGGMASGGSAAGGAAGGVVGGAAGGAVGSAAGSMAGGAVAGGAVAGGGVVAGGSAGSLSCNSARALACGTCNTTPGGAPILAYVGTGHGDFVAETTYKYVGAGCGEFEVVESKGSSSLWLSLCGGVGVLLLVAIIILLLLSPSTTSTTPTTTLPYDCDAGFANWQTGWSISKKAWCCKHSGKGCTTTAAPYDCNAASALGVADWSDAKKAWCCKHANTGCASPTKKCTFWGDPHILPFDQPDMDKSKALSFYGDGDFWVVKSTTVSIQARFEGTKYTEGLAATNQVVVGGAFLKGHKIEVGTRESGVLTVDGQAVFASFPGTYNSADGSFIVSYTAVGKVPDVIPEGNEKRVVHMELPLGVIVDVFQWNNYIDLEITMSAQPGQDGTCGNFNGDFGDDKTDTIMQRIGARVAPADSLLSGKAYIEFTPQMEKMLAAECLAATRATANTECATLLGAAPDKKLLQACQFDVCFGANVRARSHAKTYH
eukprot:CAMPEP_0115617248 /NCGR_PEP_ID=MMETSP0272-20121206/23550_1 /TAXON_ID=71861 /ORGANISM="Scrippsiella trochoidea, Strain CCMP3099" /LENGTH=533 /DNA_ID=CAMNT_0003053205 /DNA_START=51 /DNA_END=1652 /DNA_ORIENTATION=-